MTPLLRQGWFFNGISQNNGKCELGGFSLRQSHLKCIIQINDYNFQIKRIRAKISALLSCDNLIYSVMISITIHVNDSIFKGRSFMDY